MDKYLSAKLRVLSLISIVAVVYIHACTLKFQWSLLPWTPISEPLGANSFIQYFISNGLTRFAVPLFFAISGYLYFRNLTPTPMGFADKFVKRLRTIGVPYLLWSALGLALTAVLLNLPAMAPALGHWEGRGLPGFQVISEIPPTLGARLFRLFIKPVPYQLWFMRDLLLYILLSPLIYIALRRLSWGALLPAFILWFLNRNLRIMEAEGILFFMCGAYLSIHNIVPTRNRTQWLPLVLGVGWIGILLLKTGFAYQGGPFCTHTILIALHKTAILLGLFTIWLGYDLVGEQANANEFLITAAPLTFFIYAAHEPLLNLLSNYALYLLHISPTTQLTVFLMGPVVAIGLCLLFGAGLRRFTPPAFALLTGGRG